MSGMTKADYKKQAEDLAKELSDCRQFGDEYRATIFKSEADRIEVLNENRALNNEIEALRRQLKMMGDWITEALK